jgi:hypothetical protein
MYNAKYLYFVTLFFTVGCQKPQSIISKPVVSNEILNEQTQATHPQSKIHVATEILRQGSHIDSLNEVGTLKIGNDNCFYVELEGGINVLPILISGQFSQEYNNWVGKKIVGIESTPIDLMSPDYNASNIGWVTPSPHQQCSLAQAHTYLALYLYDEVNEMKIARKLPNSRKPPKLSNTYYDSKNKSAYIGVYNPPSSEVGSQFGTREEPFSEGKLFIENDCLYIRFNNGDVVLPVFNTQRTYWQDNKNALKASGKNWQLGETYFFGAYSNSVVYNLIPHGFISPPHPSCNTKQVRSIYSIYEPAEFNQKPAAYSERKSSGKQ